MARKKTTSEITPHEIEEAKGKNEHPAAPSQKNEELEKKLDALLSTVVSYNNNRSGDRLLPIGITKSISNIASLITGNDFELDVQQVTDKEETEESPLQIDDLPLTQNTVPDFMDPDISLTLKEKEYRIPNEGAIVRVSYMMDEKDSNLVTEAPLDPYDRAIYDIITSIFAFGIQSFTPELVYALLAGKSDPKEIAACKMTDAQKIRVLKSIRRCMNNKVSIRFDIGEEMKKEVPPSLRLNKKDKAYLIDKRPMLPLSENIIGVESADGASSSRIMFTFISRPPLFMYAKMQNLLQLFPSRLLQAGTSMTESAISMRNILTQTILNAYSQGRRFCVVLLTEIDPKYDEKQRNQKQRIRNVISRILDYWEKESFIKGYEYKSNYTNNQISCVYIDLKEKYDPLDYIEIDDLMAARLQLPTSKK